MGFHRRDLIIFEFDPGVAMPRIIYSLDDSSIEEEVKRHMEAVLTSINEGSLEALSKAEVEVRFDDLPEWMFAETSTQDLNRFIITLNESRYLESEARERVWHIAHELGHIVHILMEAERGRLRPPRREVILGGDEADANALALLWGFKPPRDVVEDEIQGAYREALERGVEDHHLIRYISFRSGFELSIVKEVLRRIKEGH